MNVIQINKNKLVLEFSADEIGTLGNTLSEVCYGFKVPDFEKKIGITKEEAKAILESLCSIYRKAERQRLFEE